MTTPIVRQAFGTIEPVGMGKVRASGWDEKNRTVEHVFRYHNGAIQVGITGSGGGRAFRELKPGEWATYPAWLRVDVPRALCVPGAP